MLATQLTITLAQSLVLSTESHHDYDGSRDNDDDITSSDAPIEDDVSTRKLYLEALLQ